MCVIVVKNKGTQFPSKDMIKACMKANSHGYAAAWNENGSLMTFRTMDDSEMLAKYDQIQRLDPKETALIFHARIATHGSKSLANCHCWTNQDGTLAFAHNGVLNSIGNRDDMTDSETFFRDYFLPAYESIGEEYAKSIIALAIGSSKFAFLDNNGVLKLYGNYMQFVEPGGKGTLYCSNLNWQVHYMQNYEFDRPAKKTSNKAISLKSLYNLAEKAVSRSTMSVPQRGSLVFERDANGRIVNSYINPLRKPEHAAEPQLF